MPARLPHDGDAAQWLSRSQQYGRSRAIWAADDVGTPVDTVREVDVEPTRWPEHDGRPRRRSPVCVAARVLGTQVRLDFDKAGHAPVRADQELPDEGPADITGIAGKEVPF